jgi:hypothetical protein
MREAKEYLRDLLAKGSVPAKDAEEGAEQNGISDRTLARAKKELGIKSDKDSFGGGWMWKLPEGCQDEGSKGANP